MTKVSRALQLRFNVTVQIPFIGNTLKPQSFEGWGTIHKCNNTLKYIPFSPLYGFYKAYDVTIHLFSGGRAKSACHLLPIFANPEILFGHIVTERNLKVIQEQQVVLFVVLFVFFQPVQ